MNAADNTGRDGCRTRPTFPGTINPRHIRVLLQLRIRSMRREDVDKVACCSNGPDLIAQLRRLALEIPCTRVPAFDRDGRPCFPGVYHLTLADRRKLNKWFKQGVGK